MTIKASAGSVLILAAGLWASLAGPLPAIAAGADADSAAVSKPEGAVSGKSATQGSRSLKKRYAHRKSTHTAAKPAEVKKPDEKQVADASGNIPVLPERVANANAQMTAAVSPPDSARGMSAAMSEKANSVLLAANDKPADAETPAEPAAATPTPDQPNTYDRSLSPAEQPAATTGQVGPAVGQAVVLASTSRASADASANDSSTLDKTSLIGKVFIAFGALLTLASAARMFMA
jgi:hypothetical protein